MPGPNLESQPRASTPVANSLRSQGPPHLHRQSLTWTEEFSSFPRTHNPLSSLPYTTISIITSYFPPAITTFTTPNFIQSTCIHQTADLPFFCTLHSEPADSTDAASGPATFQCEYHFSCHLGPFTRNSVKVDHISQYHNIVPPQWRLNLNKQKRRKPLHLADDYISEAKAVNSAKKRAHLAELAARGKGGYNSHHGLNLITRFQEVVRHLLSGVAVWQNLRARNGKRCEEKMQSEDLAPKLIALRTSSDQAGMLLSGDSGTFQQVAAELEAIVFGQVVVPTARMR